MLTCPAYKTEYSEGVVNPCNTCAWELIPSFPKVGDLPSYLVKEDARLE